MLFLGCGNTPFEIIKMPTSGVELTSTNYPLMHPNNVACSNVVRLNKGQRVRLTFLDFELEGSEGKWLVALSMKYELSSTFYNNLKTLNVNVQL